MILIAFVGLIFVVIGLIHFYLWKRLVTDTTRPGRLRRAGTIVAVFLALLAPATLIGVRSGYLKWLAWPGYIWIAVMFYLLVTLAVLEIPRLVISLWIRATSKPTATPENEPAVPLAAATMPATTKSSAGTESSHLGTAASAPDITASPADLDRPGADRLAGNDPAGSGPGRPAGQGAGNDSGRPAGHDPSQLAEQGAGNDSGRPAGHDAGNDPSRPAGHDATESSAGRIAADPARHQMADADKPPTRSGEETPEDPAVQSGINRRLLLARGAAIFAGLTAAGVTGYGVKTALGPPQLDRVQLPLAKLPRAMDGTRLAVVSDIHLGPLTGTQHAARIVRLINSVNADIVCIVGDLVDGSVAELGRFAAPLAGIQARRGAYFVTGNHEYYSGYQEWVAEVARLGVRPLRNERLEIEGLDLAGVNDLGGEEFGDGPDLQRALGDRDTGRPVVLMAHQPIVARDAAPFGVDLQVSGHTHGGQMAPFNLLVKLEQPVVSGLGKVDGVPVYVTNGAGFWGPPVRVGAPPQVTVIELRTP